MCLKKSKMKTRAGGALRALYQGYKGQGQHQALLSHSVLPVQPTATAYLDSLALPAQPCLPQEPACGTPGPGCSVTSLCVPAVCLRCGSRCFGFPVRKLALIHCCPSLYQLMQSQTTQAKSSMLSKKNTCHVKLLFTWSLSPFQPSKF